MKKCYEESVGNESVNIFSLPLGTVLERFAVRFKLLKLYFNFLFFIRNTTTMKYSVVKEKQVIIMHQQSSTA